MPHTEYPTSIPLYLEEALLNEGSINIENINVDQEARNELLATIQTETLAPVQQLDLLLSNHTQEHSHSNGSKLLMANAEELFCPLRFDGYLCWPRTPAGTVLSQYCPDFVEGFNNKFLAHKT